jgi:hypothetical protein
MFVKIVRFWFFAFYSQNKDINLFRRKMIFEEIFFFGV